jgi:hypothetical protein
MRENIYERVMMQPQIGGQSEEKPQDIDVYIAIALSSVRAMEDIMDCKRVTRTERVCVRD